MKQNNFHIIVGIIGLIEVLLFWIGAVLYFVLRRTIIDGYART